MPLKKTCCEPVPEGFSHSKSLPRMNRAIGQLEGAKKMIAADRYCLDILTQLRAARASIRALEAEIFKRHLEGCVANSLSRPKDAVEKIAEIKRFLDFVN